MQNEREYREKQFYGVDLGVGWLVSLKIKFENKNNPASAKI